MSQLAQDRQLCQKVFCSGYHWQKSVFFPPNGLPPKKISHKESKSQTERGRQPSFPMEKGAKLNPAFKGFGRLSPNSKQRKWRGEKGVGTTRIQREWGRPGYSRSS
jgi:hypothetical protein